jgi:alpha-ketoglutarate-dependent taurine dioxygenase
MSGFSHTDFNCDPLSAEELANGHAKFVHFHFDGIMYDSHPSRVTTFRCVKQPKGPDVTLHVGDAAGSTMKCRPGSTAFISCAQIYNLLTEEEKKVADHSYWEPAPHPFGWSGTRMYTSNGLGIAPRGETVPLNKLPPWEASKVYKYPLVWLNPVTEEKGFQIMPQCVRKLFLRSSPEEEVRVVDDLEEIRIWLNNTLDRVANPEYILIPSCEEGDMIVWNNWVSVSFHFTPSQLSCQRASFTVPLNTRLVMEREPVSICTTLQIPSRD